jgi:DNA-binding response OmpR family regulator
VRILVVEDETYAADTLAVLLRAAGHEVIVAYDGAAGIAAGVAGHFDGAVVDLGLGAVDGYVVANALRAHHGNSLRLIAYTGFSGAEVHRRAHASGFDRVITKPAAVQSIVAALGARQS